MKKILFGLISVIICFIIIGLCLNIPATSKNQNANFLRIHIRANSNDNKDQEIKYKVKDEFVKYLTPKIALCNSKSDVVELIGAESGNLVELANHILKEAGFDYRVNISIKSEMFPTRAYDDYVLESGIYDAMIVELGEAQGNNWWCVIYPPLCFTNYQSNNYVGVVYKSKILEIIKKFFS